MERERLTEGLSTEQIQSAIARYRDTAFAEWIVVAIGLAAQTHPEEMRKALASVFDVSAIEEHTKKMMLSAEIARKVGIETRELYRSISQDIDRLEKRLDAINYEISQWEKRIRATARLAKAI